MTNRGWPARSSWLLCPWLVLLATTLQAQPVSLSVSQTWTGGATVTAYLYPRGQDGLPAVAVSPAVTATVANHTLHASSVRQFDGGVAYILLADVSKSMRPGQFEDLRKAMQGFASNVTNQDRMAIVSFGNDVQVVQDFTADVPLLNQGLETLKPAGDETRLYLAVSRALEMGQRMDAALPGRRAIVVLTDGKDEGSGLNVEDLLSTMRDARIPVYSVGSSRLKEPEKKQYLDMLRRISANSGGEYFDAAASFSESYERIRKSVTGVLLVEFDCSLSLLTGKPETWTFSLQSGDKVLTASTAIPMPLPPASPVVPVPTPPPPSPFRKQPPLIAGVIVAVAIVLIAGAVRRRRKKQMLARQMVTESTPILAPAPPALPLVMEEPVQPAPAPAPPLYPSPAPPVPGLPIRLFVMRGDQRQSVHELQLAMPTTFGSGPSCGFALPQERSLAAQQFELSYGNQRVLIRDLSGNASTTVNGVPIRSSHPLNHGDIIGAGGAEFRLLIGK